jgi:Ca2+-dependent lipid-binding protein
MYNESEALLVVTVEKASDLPHRADGTPVDAYIRLFFIPKLPELPQRRTNKTKAQRRDNSPVFNEVVEYEAMSAEELINSNLHVEVLDYRSYGKHMVLGQANIPLIQVQFVRGEASITLPLKIPKVS